MAKTRMISTCFWSDSFIQELNSTDKLFYLYLLTNEHTDICGIYEITLKTMSFETGIGVDTISKAIDRLSKANKISYADGWIFLKNFQKHQQKNPKVQKGIEAGIKRVPKAIFDRLCIDYDSLSHFNLNLNLNSNSNFNSKKETKEKYLEFVLLTFEEHTKLGEQLGLKERDAAIERLNLYLGSTGKKYKSHYFTILNWNRKNKETNTPPKAPRIGSPEYYKPPTPEQLLQFKHI